MGSILISRNSHSWSHVGAHEQPINERAWTLQEALLTHRLLMFTDTNVVWRCQTSFRPDFFENHGSIIERHGETLTGHPGGFATRDLDVGIRLCLYQEDPGLAYTH